MEYKTYKHCCFILIFACVCINFYRFINLENEIIAWSCSFFFLALLFLFLVFQIYTLTVLHFKSLKEKTQSCSGIALPFYGIIQIGKVLKAMDGDAKNLSFKYNDFLMVLLISFTTLITTEINIATLLVLFIYLSASQTLEVFYLKRFM